MPQAQDKKRNPACDIRHRAQHVTVRAKENDETAKCSKEEIYAFARKPPNNVTGREFPRGPSKYVNAQKEHPKFLYAVDVDSVALFQQRIVEMGILALQGAFFHRCRCSTPAFCFSSSGARREGPRGCFFSDEALKRLCPSETFVESEQAAAVRQLCLEAQVVTVSDLRRQTTRAEDDLVA